MRPDLATPSVVGSAEDHSPFPQEPPHDPQNPCCRHAGRVPRHGKRRCSDPLRPLGRAYRRVVRHVLVPRNDDAHGLQVANYPPETYAAALTRQAVTMGNPETIRYFYGSSPLRWPPSGGFAGTRPMVVSFNRSPVLVNKGTYDAEIRAFLAAQPKDRITWVAYEHEMDAKVKKGHYAAADVISPAITIGRSIGCPWPRRRGRPRSPADVTQPSTR